LPGAALVVLAGVLVAGIARGPVTVDRATPPRLGPAPSVSVPPIARATLSNGLPVWIVESHAVPLVQVNLVVHAGSADDPAGQFGLASLTAAMLDEGAGTRTALQISDDVEFLGASLATGSAFDSSAVRLNVPSSRLDEALPIMADVALHPTFPDEDLERLRQERLTALIQTKSDAAALVPLVFARTVFGPEHRFGTGTAGTEATLKAFTAASLRAFHAEKFRPTNATLIVTGDVTMAALVPQLERVFGGWTSQGAVTRTDVLPAPQLTAGGITIVDMPSAEQIRIGWVGVPRSTPDYFPLEVLNTILGGSFTSRLNQNLREQHGYSYGASSRFDMRRSPGPFLAGAGVQTDKTAEALREFFNELNGIRTPVSDEELAKARNYLALSFPASFETIGDLSGHLEELAVYSLPDGFFSTYVANVQGVTAAQVKAAAERYIQPSRFAVVVVGDRAKIEPGIRALNLGPVRTLTVDEALP
jgi:zinc protease